MKKTLLTAALLWVVCLSYAQVGINTTTPQATLDIEASSISTPSNVDGILIPRMDEFPATDPTSTQDGMMIFITGDGAPTKGFYYWDDDAGPAAWISIGTAGTNTQNTLDEAYDEGGAGAGRVIVADNGAMDIQGAGGLRVEGNITAAEGIVHDGDADTFQQFTTDRIQVNVGGQNYIDIQNDDLEMTINEESNASDFRVESDNQEHMLFLDGSTDAIGIGEDEPVSPIHVGVRTSFDLSYLNTGQDGVFIKGGNDNSGANAIGGSIAFGPALPVRGDQRKAAISAVQTSSDEDNIGLAFYVHRSDANLTPMEEGMRLNHEKQLGINTNDPKATLDIQGRSIGTPQAFDGILIPRADEFASPSPGAEQDGMMIFATGDGTPSKGLYYWDNDAAPPAWVPIGGSDNDWTEVGSDLERQSGNIYIGDDASTDNDLYISNRLMDWDDTSYFLDPSENSRVDEINFDIGSDTDPSIRFQDDDTGIHGSLAGQQIDFINNGNQTLSLFSNNHVAVNTTNDNGQLGVVSDEFGTHALAAHNTAAGYGIDVYITGNRTASGGVISGISMDNDATSSISINKFGINNIATGGGDGAYVGQRNSILGTSSYSGSVTALENYIASPTATEIYAVNNTVIGSSNANKYGTYNVISGGTGDKYGTYTEINASNPGTHYGIYSDVQNSSSYAGYFLGRTSMGTGTTNRYLMPATDGTSGQVMATNGSGQLSFVNAATDTDDQTIDTFSMSGTTLSLSLQDDGQAPRTVNLASLQDGDWYEENTFSPTSSIFSDIFTNGNVGIGVSNVLYPLHVEGTTPYTASLENSGTGSANRIGIRNEMNGTGHAKIGLNNILSGTGNGVAGQTIGVDNDISINASSGTLYGIFNRYDDATGNRGYGIFNRFSDTSSWTNDVSGVSNSFNTDAQFSYGIRSSFSGTTPTNFGVYNSNSNSIDSDNYGLYNTFTNSGDGEHYGAYTNLTGAGSGSKYGHYVRIDSGAGGTHYGIYSDATKTGSYAGYFLGKISIGTNTSNTYELPSSRGAADQIMQTDSAGNVSWQSPSTIFSDTDDQTIDTFSLTGSTLSLSLEDDGQLPQYVDLSSIAGDVTAVNAGAGLTGGGTSASVTVTANANNGLNVDTVADAIQWGGSLTENTTITHGNFDATYNLNGTGDFVVQDSGTDSFIVGNDGNTHVRGNLGINDLAPDGRISILHNSTGATNPHMEVTAQNANSGSRIVFNNAAETTNNWVLFARADNTAGGGILNFFSSEVATNVLRLESDGKVGIMRNPTTNVLEVAGDASKTTAGSWLANSDKRLKNHIASISGNTALQKIEQMRGVTYQWNDDKTGMKRPEGIQYGFIAQELMEVFPEKVTQDNLGYYQTAYGDYDPIFVEAIKELKTRLDALKEENELLKKQLEQFKTWEARIEHLENTISDERVMKE